MRLRVRRSLVLPNPALRPQLRTLTGQTPVIPPREGETQAGI